ncbi:MAG: hypothetical protein U9O64_05425 [Campylobacterota bacterium]|nr:hypothetical protein [Campylobacterota bacterium]
MKSVKEMNMEELAAYVCTSLENEGIDTVLSFPLSPMGMHKSYLQIHNKVPIL